MNILFLGTGAADWNAEMCDMAKGEYRRYSSLLLDKTLLIDPGLCVPNALKAFGVSPSEIKYIINTHTHSDHYSQKTVDILKAEGAQFIKFGAADKKRVGGYMVRAFSANHGTCEDAVHFIISDGLHSLFYGLDGAWLTFDEIKAIKESHIDIAVLDGTIGDVSGDYRIFEHNNLKMVEEMKASLEKYIDRFIISHMAQSLHSNHATLVKRMEKSGIEVAFDGLEINISQ